MRKIIIAALLAVAINAPVQAQVFFSREAQLACPMDAFVAGDIMERRQAGEPKDRLVREMKQQTSPRMREYGLYMVDAAYMMPIVSGKAQEMIVQGFKDSFYVYCLKQMSGG